MDDDKRPDDQDYNTRTLSDACADGQHHACKPWGKDEDSMCDCSCHDNGPFGGDEDI